MARKFKDGQKVKTLVPVFDEFGDKYRKGRVGEIFRCLGWGKYEVVLRGRKGNGDPIVLVKTRDLEAV